MSRFERWSREGMPSDAENEKIQRNISRAMAGAIADAYHGISTSASMIPDHVRDEAPPRPPSGGTVELGPQPGITIIDRMVEADTRRQQLIAMQQQAELREIERRLDPIEDNVESEYEPFDAEHMKK